jgi:hypothetical protein
MAEDMKIEGESLKRFRLHHERLSTTESFDTAQEVLDRIQHYRRIFGDAEKFTIFDGRYKQLNMAQLRELAAEERVLQSRKPHNDL